SQAVHFLRRTLGAEAIVSRADEELGVNQEMVWCDAIAFEAALDAGKAAEALELYRGALLEGFHVSDAAPEFGRWLDDERARLSRRHAQAVEETATARRSEERRVGKGWRARWTRDGAQRKRERRA